MSLHAPSTPPADEPARAARGPAPNRAASSRVAALAAAAVAALAPPTWTASPAPLQDALLPSAPGRADEELDPAVVERLGHLDPGRDAWPEEVWNNEAGQALKALGKRLSGSSADAHTLATDELRVVLRPALELRRESDAFRVYVPSDESAMEEPLPLAAALDALREPFGEESPVPYFKVLSARETPGGFESDVLFATDGPQVQQRAHWRCRWERAGDQLLLAGIAVSDFEEVRRTRPGTLFEDCSESLFAKAPSWRAQMLPGLPYWRAQLDSGLGLSMLGHHGVSVGDFDGDGREDLYVCQPGGLPNRLYQHQADGTARDVAAELGLDFLDAARCALWLDLDGDADQDLVVAFFHDILVLENDAGEFRERSVLELPTLTSLAAADYDLDGDLDLYACSYVAPYDDSVAPTPYHDANNGRANALFRNEGDWTFVDVTEETGLDVNNRRFSFAAGWEDLDNDGDPDLYVANDFGRNNLYRNDGGRFVDIAEEAGVEDISAGMGVTFSDVDRDGRMDLYVSNMFSSAGHRVSYTRRFHGDASEADRASYRRHARGNSLFLNAGDGTFRDASVSAGVTMGRWAWGALFCDLDNDGREDLVVPNGFVTGHGAFDDL